MIRLVLLLFFVGCAPTRSQVGPYVKHVARNGDWLVIHKCMIVLEGVELGEAACTVEQMPLRALPQVAPPMQPSVAPVASPTR